LKFVLFVEGDTEERVLPAFLKRWLDPRLPKPIGIRTVKFRGSGHYAQEIRKKVHLSLSGSAGEGVVAAIGILDLYGPTFYPSDRGSAEARMEWAKRHFEERVGHPRFSQHFAVHELEAWLLADRSILPEKVGKALPGRCSEPERVNFDEPPATLLDKVYRTQLGKPYKKVVDGANLFKALRPETAAEKCPRLHGLLQEMLVRATQNP